MFIFMYNAERFTVRKIGWKFFFGSFVNFKSLTLMRDEGYSGDEEKGKVENNFGYEKQ